MSVSSAEGLEPRLVKRGALQYPFITIISVSFRHGIRYNSFRIQSMGQINLVANHSYSMEILDTI